MSDTQMNPLLSKIQMPGRIFQLPSKGIFYTNGELADDVKDGEIHVHPLSAIDEINLKNPDQLFSGAAVQEVLPRCCPQIKKPGLLLSKDVDAIMMFLRTVTYGSGFELMVKHTCKEAKDHSYVIDVDQLISASKTIDPTTIESAYSMKLPNGQALQLQPNRYAHLIDIVKGNQGKVKLSVKEMEQNLLQMLSGIIISVDSISDPAMISEWLQEIPAPWVTRIAEKVESVNSWGPNLVTQVTCRDCGEAFDIEVPINPVSFFTE